MEWVVGKWCLQPLGYQLIFTILLFAWAQGLRMGKSQVRWEERGSRKLRPSRLVW